MKDNTLSSVQTSPSDVSRFKSYRAHHFPYNSYSYAIETKRSESLGVGHRWSVWTAMIRLPSPCPPMSH